MGLARSMGRFTLEESPKFCQLFSENEKIPVIGNNSSMDKEKLNRSDKLFFNYRSINSHILTNDIVQIQNEGDRSFQSIHSNFQHEGSFYSPKCWNPYSLNLHQFLKQHYKKSGNESSYKFNLIHLQSILALAKKILTKTVLSVIDDETNQVKVFL